MASQNDTTDLNIQFIVESKYKSADECSEDMWHAFNKCDELDTKPEWVLEKDCSALKPGKTDVFILEIFSGAVFEHLKKFKSSILGPRCLLKCFTTGNPLPATTSPVLNTAMENVVISISGFPTTVKDEMQKKVEYMGGVFSKQLRMSVTHLVTNSVMTAKYEAATKSGLVVVQPGWVDAIWEANLIDFVPAKDIRFDRYKCPIFYNLIATSTNLSVKNKEELKDIITKNGGEFSGLLDVKKIKVVLTLKDSGTSKKIQCAEKNNIPCLSYEWVYDSVREGYALPLEDYVVGPHRKCSTPEKADVTFNEHASIDISRISSVTSDYNGLVQETLQQSIVSSGMNSIIVSTGTIKSIPQIVASSHAAIVDKMNIEDVKKAGNFLDGCSIYLIGFSGIHREKLNKILSFSGATRLDEPNESLTHVIIGDSNKSEQEIKSIQFTAINPFILNINWLVESIKLKKAAFEDDFLIEPRQKVEPKKKSIEPASPLSKKSLSFMKPRTPTAMPSSNYIRRLNSTDSGNPCDEDSEETDLVMKYLQVPDSNTLTNVVEQGWSKSPANQITNSVAQPSSSKIDCTSDIDAQNVSSISFSQDPNTSSIFKGHTFVFAKFTDEEMSSLAKLVKKHGGKTAVPATEVPDFAVVPLINGSIERKIKTTVSNLYIEECIEECELVSVEYYHRPIVIPKNVKPLKNCVVSMTSYDSFERKYLQNLSEILGARYQDTFARTLKLEQNTYINTHLICPEAQGKKYIAAVKWKIPAVTADWLVSCAEKKACVDEEPYLVGESKVPAKETKDFSNKGTSTPPTKSAAADEEKTPSTRLVNKRLVSVMEGNVPQSPFHVDTPNSPYGRCFQDNPSKKFRKDCKKWVDQLPDWHEPPAKKPRRNSTPLSELKRRLMDKAAKELNISVPGENAGSSGNDDDHSSLMTNRRLSYSDAENEPVDDIKQALKSVSDLRQSLSGESNKPSEEERFSPTENIIITDTQPDLIGWQHVERKPETSQKEPVKRFMMSGVKDRQALEDIIVKLGGEVSNTPYLDMEATHVICLKPGRNEKMVGSIASGKWVLHINYLVDSSQNEQFLDEEDYEFGNPRSKNNIPPVSSETERLIAAAAYRWRTKLSRDPTAPFQDMIALLLVQEEKCDQFKRLIIAGGGAVVDCRPPYDSTINGRKITHCFIQPKQTNQQIEWATLASKGILCFPPQYLSDHLTSETPLNLRECVLPEFKKFLPLMPT